MQKRGTPEGAPMGRGAVSIGVTGMQPDSSGQVLAEMVLCVGGMQAGGKK
jgi:hypothetical protein